MITHIMKDGRILKDITGHVVKESDAKRLYDYIRSQSVRKEEVKK